MNPTLQAVDLIKRYRQGIQEKEVLKGASYTFEVGKTYGLQGVSGSGKSTFLHLLGGLDVPTSGKVLYNQRDISLYSLEERQHFLRFTVGFMFQFHYLVMELSVLENLMIPLLVAHKSHSDATQRARELLDLVGLADKQHAYPATLSGGEQQRVAAMRALVNKPQFFIADEPTGNLDHENAYRLLDFVKQCQREWAMAVIICSHDRAIIERTEEQFELSEGLMRRIL